MARERSIGRAARRGGGGDARADTAGSLEHGRPPCAKIVGRGAVASGMRDGS